MIILDQTNENQGTVLRNERIYLRVMY